MISLNKNLWKNHLYSLIINNYNSKEFNSKINKNLIKNI